MSIAVEPDVIIILPLLGYTDLIPSSPLEKSIAVEPKLAMIPCLIELYSSSGEVTL